MYADIDRDVLLEILDKVPLLKLERETFRPRGTPSSRNLLLVLLHDLLFSTRARIEASDKWPPKAAVARHQARLKAELVRIQLRAGVSSVRELGRTANADVQARYVRWNPNIDAARVEDWSLQALHTYLASKGFSRIEEAVYPVPSRKYFMDPHLPDYLLVFPPETNWWAGDRWYESGAVVLQDKASCFPAAVIMDGWDGGECIDGTAAPGNKTSLMSALMGNEGTLYAFEKSAHRFRTLEKMLARAGCTNTTATRGDFTLADPADYPNVTRILLDPSCSGSGIVNRLDYLVEQDESEDDGRLDKLAAFQLQMIQHAFKCELGRRGDTDSSPGCPADRVLDLLDPRRGGRACCREGSQVRRGEVARCAPHLGAASVGEARARRGAGSRRRGRHPLPARGQDERVLRFVL